MQVSANQKQYTLPLNSGSCTLNPLKNNMLRKLLVVDILHVKVIGAIYQAYSDQKLLTIIPKLTIQF